MLSGQAKHALFALSTSLQSF